LRALKFILMLVVVLALGAGAVMLALHLEGGDPGAPDAPVQTGTASGGVVINEFMASNGGYLPDDQGDYSDWIELYNPGSSAVSLSGMALSDDKTRALWPLPNISLKAGGYMIVYASGKNLSDPDKPLHANFRLSAAGGGVYLMAMSKEVLDSVEYEAQQENMSLGRSVSDGSWQVFDKPTPGFSNDEAGLAAFEQSRKAADSPLVITEVMPSNRTTLADNTGAYNDYIEIYNAGGEAASLLGYGLSDDPSDVMAWRFPDVSIGPGEYLVVFASGADTANTDLEKGAIHTNFRVSAYRETIVLSTSAGLLIDQVDVAQMSPDTAWVRAMESGTYGSSWAEGSPSPGYPNTDEGAAQFRAEQPAA
jgi:hypothetical protein